MCKEDTNFAKLVLEAARKLYGKNFNFDKCIIEKKQDYSYSLCNNTGYFQGSEPYYVVTFEISKKETL